MNRRPSAAQVEAIRTIQGRVRAMLVEREALGPVVRPSRYWADFCRNFDYMLDLAPAAFGQLRIHTYHLTGDNYQTYYFGQPGPFLDFWGPWLDSAGLPPAHVLAEPEGGIGYRLADGRFVSQDVARFQRSVTALSRQGVLGDLARWPKPAWILEIGGGYGGLAYHLTRIVPRARYVLVDLPETLVFSATYLTLHAPMSRIELYDPAAPPTPEQIDRADFLLVPDYRLDLLRDRRFDLAVNLASLQEMRRDQVERYLDFLRLTCRLLYSCNRDHQNRNDELPGLFNLIRSRFDLTELPPLPSPPLSARTRLKRALRGAAGWVGLAEPGDGNSPDPYPFVEHLGRPLPGPA